MGWQLWRCALCLSLCSALLSTVVGLQQSTSSSLHKRAYTVSGRLIWPGEDLQSVPLLLELLTCAAGSCTVASSHTLCTDSVAKAANIRLQLRVNGGKMDMTWPKASGAFTFLDIPEGSHLLDVVAVDLIYPQVMPCHSQCRPAGRARVYATRSPCASKGPCTGGHAAGRLRGAWDLTSIANVCSCVWM